MKKLLAPLLTGALFAGGCSSITSKPYAAPQLQLPGGWSTPTHADTAAASAYWWQAFNDAGLNTLMEQVLRQNNDLAVAALQLRRAQLTAGLVASNSRPDFSASVGASRREPLDNGSGSGSTSYSASVGVSYEVDLWGRLGAARSSARWAAKASAEDLESAALALTATTANLYWQLGYLNQRVTLAAQGLADAQKTQELVQVRYRAGAISGLDAAEAEQNLASQQVALNQLVQQRTRVRNALALLLGTPGAALDAAPTGLIAIELPPVAEGLPATLLANRPDLRAAELRLRAAYRDIEATQAEFYPALTLTGSVGNTSPALSQLVQNPVATLGAGLVLPFLNWNERRLGVKIAEADYEAAVATFRQRLLTAFTEVEDALSARAAFNERQRWLEQALAAAQKAEGLYAIRYRAGAVSLQDWLAAQEKRRSAEVALAGNQFDRLVNHATLVQALGGSPVLPGASGAKVAP
jgi:NodT family efflux transporter outer membrane factor (OMF) lipoprotein